MSSEMECGTDPVDGTGSTHDTESLGAQPLRSLRSRKHAHSKTMKWRCSRAGLQRPRKETPWTVGRDADFARAPLLALLSTDRNGPVACTHNVFATATALNGVCTRPLGTAQGLGLHVKAQNSEHNMYLYWIHILYGPSTLVILCFLFKNRNIIYYTCID